MKILICDSDPKSVYGLLARDESMQSLQKIGFSVGSVTLLPHSCTIIDRHHENSERTQLFVNDIVKMIKYLTKLPLYTNSIASNGISIVFQHKITRNLYTESKFHSLLYKIHTAITINCQH